MNNQKGNGVSGRECLALRGIVITSLIVMVREQRQNKNTGGGGEMVTKSDGWTVTANRE